MSDVTLSFLKESIRRCLRAWDTDNVAMVCDAFEKLHGIPESISCVTEGWSHILITWNSPGKEYDYQFLIRSRPRYQTIEIQRNDPRRWGMFTEHNKVHPVDLLLFVDFISGQSHPVLPIEEHIGEEDHVSPQVVDLSHIGPDPPPAEDLEVIDQIVDGHGEPWSPSAAPQLAEEARPPEPEPSPWRPPWWCFELQLPLTFAQADGTIEIVDTNDGNPDCPRRP